MTLMFPNEEIILVSLVYNSVHVHAAWTICCVVASAFMTRTKNILRLLSSFPLVADPDLRLPCCVDLVLVARCFLWVC